MASFVFPYSEDGLNKEFLIIELQGEIVHLRDNLKKGNDCLGNIERISDTTYILFIGKHKIEGKLEPLRKPLLLCKKGENGILIQACAKNKILFKKRPVPILEDTKRMKQN